MCLESEPAILLLLFGYFHRYQSSSPDENAMVKAAASMKYTFYVRTPTHVTVNMVRIIPKVAGSNPTGGSK